MAILPLHMTMPIKMCLKYFKTSIYQHINKSNLFNFNVLTVDRGRGQFYIANVAINFINT